MYKGFKYRIYPTDTQKSWFEEHFEVNRYLFNVLLDATTTKYRNEADAIFLESIKEIDFYSPEILSWTTSDWKKFLKVSKKGAKGYSRYDMCKLITKIINDPAVPWVNKTYEPRSMRTASEFVDCAFKNFYRGFGYPKFKRPNSVHSIKIPVTSIKGWKSIHFLNQSTLHLPKGIQLKIVQHRPFEGELKYAIVSKTSSGKWFISLVSDIGDGYLLPATQKIIGLDQGTRHFLTGHTSDNETIVWDKPDFHESLEKKLLKTQKSLSRKQERAKKEHRSLKESKNYQKNRIEYAKICEKIKNKNNYFLQSLSSELIETYDVIFIEGWSIQDFVKSDLGYVVEKGERIVQRRKSKKIMEMSFFSFREMLKQKAKIYGKTVIELPKAVTPNRFCSECGEEFEESILYKDKVFDCPFCGAHLSRSENSAKNILSEGCKLLEQ